jgi:CxxC-x17-CxxC domain-containing protein
MAFNRDSRSGGRGFGRRRFDGGRGGDRQMFKATCSNCGKECEVPFKPTGSKPVYCRDCFRTMKTPDSRSTYDRGSRKPNFDNGDRRGSSYPQYKEQFETLNAKLDQIIKLLNPEKLMEAPKVVTESQVKEESKGVENVKPAKNVASRSLAAISQGGIPPKPTPHFAKASLGVPLAPSSSKKASRYSAKGKKTRAKKVVPRETDIPTKTPKE